MRNLCPLLFFSQPNSIGPIPCAVSEQSLCGYYNINSQYYNINSQYNSMQHCTYDGVCKCPQDVLLVCLASDLIKNLHFLCRLIKEWSSMLQSRQQSPRIREWVDGNAVYTQQSAETTSSWRKLLSFSLKIGSPTSRKGIFWPISEIPLLATMASCQFFVVENVEDF